MIWYWPPFLPTSHPNPRLSIFQLSSSIRGPNPWQDASAELPMCLRIVMISIDWGRDNDRVWYRIICTIDSDDLTYLTYYRPAYSAHSTGLQLKSSSTSRHPFFQFPWVEKGDNWHDLIQASMYHINYCTLRKDTFRTSDADGWSWLDMIFRSISRSCCCITLTIPSHPWPDRLTASLLLLKCRWYRLSYTTT